MCCKRVEMFANHLRRTLAGGFAPPEKSKESPNPTVGEPEVS
jgi:hypothetical protein